MLSQTMFTQTLFVYVLQVIQEAIGTSKWEVKAGVLVDIPVDHLKAEVAGCFPPICLLDYPRLHFEMLLTVQK